VSTTTPTTDAPGVKVKFVIAKLNARGEISELKADDELVSCTDAAAADRYVGCDNVYGLYFEPAQEAYIYAFQQDETGKTDVLFPNGEFSEQGNPVAAGAKLWVPNKPKPWFYLGVNDPPDPSEETIFVAASAERIEVLESYIACVIDTCPDLDPNQEALQKWIMGFLGGVGGTTDPSGPIRDREGNLTDLETLILNLAGEDELVHQVKFKNLPPD
jgi:hypothetical protein